MPTAGVFHSLIIVTFFPEIMTNNSYTWTDDFSGLVEKYAEHIMDSMDMKTMEQFVFDTLVGNLNNYTEEELINEVREYYGDEWFDDNDVELKESTED